MARQLRQTRGRKGPRKTRKQGKRKGGKTRKRVMGKRRKRTMRKVRGGASESGFGQGVKVWNIKYDIIKDMKVDDHWKRFWKEEDRVAFEQIMIDGEFAEKKADGVVYLIDTPRMVPYAIEQKYLKNIEVKEFLESLERRYLDSLEEDLNEEEEEGTGVHEPVEENKRAERKGYMRRLREKLFRRKRV